MGHTVASQRIMVDLVIGELMAYGKALREEDRKIFFELLKYPLKKVSAISYANSMHVWAFLIISMIIELEKKHESVSHGRVPEGELNNPLDQD
jgi:hypothetical protein